MPAPAFAFQRFSVWLAVAALSAWSAVAVHSVSAQNPGAGLYGLRFVDIEDERNADLRDGVATALSPLYVANPIVEADPELVEVLRESLVQQQLELGPYAAELSELTLSLGQQLLAAGEYPAAVRALSQALHVGRINEGLATERQLPALRLLLLAHRMAGDFAALDDRYGYVAHLYSNRALNGDTEAVAGMLDYLRWQRRAAVLEVEGSQLRRLLAAYDTSRALVDGALATPGSIDAELLEPLIREHLAMLYALTQINLPTVVVIDSRSPMRRMGPRSNDPFAREASPEEQRLFRIQQGMDGEVRRLLESAPQSHSAQISAARRVALGDWQQWHGRWRLAAAEYRAAIAELRAAGLAELAENWFAKPLELPDPMVFGAGQGERYRERSEFRLQFDVTAQGQVRNIQALEPEQENRTLIVVLQRQLRATRFRPRLEGDTFAATQGLQRSYRLYHDR